MNVNATLINLYHICKREMWLHCSGINMEHTSDIVYDGKLLHETSYPQRAERHTEMELNADMDGIHLTGKIDFYDAASMVIHETKRSDKVEDAHEWQVKYYIWLLELNGIHGVSGILEYPKLRLTTEVQLTGDDRKYLQDVIASVITLQESESCPPVVKRKICKSCSYYEFCYVGEE